MWRAVKLPDVHDVAFVFEHRRFVVVNIEVVWSREDGHHGGETCGLRFPIHTVSAIKRGVREKEGNLGIVPTLHPELRVLG